MRYLLTILLFVSLTGNTQVIYIVQQPGQYIAYGLSTDTKPSSPPDNCLFVERNTGDVYKSLSSAWALAPFGTGLLTVTKINKVTVTAPATGATLTIPDGTTINTGAGGTLGSNAFTSTSYQPTLVSGTNIKTINGSTVLGSGDLVVSGAAAWGSITGALSNQTDLNNALNLKAPLASPTFTGTVSGVTATMVGLGNVTNESKATMFTSPTFTGTPTGIGFPVYAQVTGSNATTTGQALVNVTGLSVALAINATYEFEAVMSVSTSAVTTGTAYGVNYSAAGAAVEAHITGASTSTAAKTLRISALNTATTLYLATSAQTGGVLIKGRVTTGANAGNFTVSHLKLTSGTSTVFIGSFLKVTRIL